MIHPLLDFGAGCAHLNDYIIKKNIININSTCFGYFQKFCKVIANKYPNTDVYDMDILNKNDCELLPEFDYIIMNGVFTEKRELTDEKMWDFFNKY